MKNIVLSLVLILLTASWGRAQVSAVSIIGAGSSGGTGSSVPVTILVTDDGQFGTIHYDVLFSAASTVSSTAYSSFLAGPMVCAGVDSGYTTNDRGNQATTITIAIPGPQFSYSGHLLIIAVENQPFLQCSSAFTATSFTAFTPTPTATMTKTMTYTPTITPTASYTPAFSYTNTPTFTATSTFTATPTYTQTFTPTFTPTATPTFTQTATPTNTP
jgi:hypothetical protein